MSCPAPAVIAWSWSSGA